MTQDPYPVEQPQYGAQNTPQISPQEERTWGTISHIAPLAAMVLSAGTLGFIASVIIYVMYKDKGPFVRAQAANSLNIQIITGIVLLVSIPLMLLVIGFFTFGLALLFAFVMHIIGAMKANSGEWWDPPLTPKFVR